MIVMDGLRSLIGKFGQPSRDKGAAVVFAETSLTDGDLRNAYESNFLARKVVDIPATDALRKWRSWTGEESAEIEAEEARLDVHAKTLNALIQARLLGGAAIYIGTDQDPATPLDVEAIGPGGVKYLNVLTRTELVAGLIDQDPMSPTHRRPADYSLAGAAGQVTIHPSRLVFMKADRKADPWLDSSATAGWDNSVLKATADTILQTSGSLANVAALVHEANIDTLSIKGLSTLIKTPAGEAAVVKRASLFSLNKGVNGLAVLDKESEELARRSTSFADLPHVIETLALMIAAGADIPATRFLARSPTGLSNTGSHDQSNYQDKLQGMQRLEIGPALSTFDKALVRSAGVKRPDDARPEWRPLRQLDESELAELADKVAEMVERFAKMGIFSKLDLRRLALHRLAETRAMPHAEEMIGEDAPLGIMLDAPTLVGLVTAVEKEQAAPETVTEYLRSCGLLVGVTDDQARQMIASGAEARSARTVGM